MKHVLACLLVGAGGALGSMARYGAGMLIVRHFPHRFPAGTFLVNLTGCFLIGLLAPLIAQRVIPGGERAHQALVLGFLGGYTTFSSYAMQSYEMMKASDWRLALLNTIGSVVFGLLAVAAGVAVAGQLKPPG